MEEQNQSLTKFDSGSPEQKEFLQKIEKISIIVNALPPENMIENFKGEFDYLPISFLETKMDEIFFGHWSTQNFKYMQVINEIVGDLELKFIHPISGHVITRTGAGAVAIMQKSGKPLSEFTETKIKNALVMGFPRLKAECFKNAVKGIGKLFGRDLNRNLSDSYEPLIGIAPDDVIEIVKMNIMSELSNYKGDDREEIKKMCVEAQEKDNFDMDFAKVIADKLGMPL